ncbi:HAMP domain-containing histidine kinase [Streptomyces californicus]|uniref:histidine kinase n=1 Tax=Streptomyces californicus TaxID=67351 RepID=A0ABD7CVF5_9ACTN|nr:MULTISPECIES: HAMP domain-containing sensor histidine kinase [Streptomyces]QRV30140.1 HAMP domain-containing histidine kinase [Streptomyces californicus]QRV34252.1 HAMP domain-containing histidine kinase [Streptomyces californicus]QRV43555.1 HAMP domain-containing histidine kinase [Streptomyces californicus]QRV50242.1 HAMP domain-containing histidine kinase [Streptomyces californicus]
MRRRRFRSPSWTASLTWKSAVFLTAMCCTLAALLGFLVHTAVTRQVVEQAREKTLSKLEATTDAYEAGEPLPPGSGVDPPGLPGSLRALAAGGERGTLVADAPHPRHGRPGPAMWAAGPADGRALAAWTDYGHSARTIAGLDRAIIGSSLLAIAATLLAGLFAVGRVTRRLHQSARVARRISAGDLDARVADPRTARPVRAQDEVAIVAGALDTMASTLQRKLQTEQRFTADVAHELRTPLTGLTAATELLPPGRPTELVRDRVRAMRALTEDLLEISRLDARTEQVDLAVHDLGPVAERVVRASGAPTEVRLGRAARVETDRRRLERVIGNLVANAHRHGAPPVVLEADGPVVSVRDHGPGFPAYLLEGGPQRFRTEGAGKGHGLGLTIALGQAEVIGARLEFAEAPDGGALARLTLPEYVAFDDGDGDGNPGGDRGPDGGDDPDGSTRGSPHGS